MPFINFLRTVCHSFGIHPRRWLDALFTYPRYLGIIKPELLKGDREEYLIWSELIQRAWRPQKISVPLGKRLLAISPHPDDEILGAGGLLLAHRPCSEIHLLAIFSGDYGGSLLPNEVPHLESSEYRSRLSDARRIEFRSIAEQLGAKTCQLLDHSDNSMPLSSLDQQKMKNIVETIQPDIIILPWFFDDLSSHRIANILYAWACGEYPCMVFAYEVWSLLHPNMVLDISNYLDEKIRLVKNYRTQLTTIDYLSYVKGLAAIRAFHHPVRNDRSGAVEGYLALPNEEYCKLVRHFYGNPGQLRKDVLKEH